MAERSKAIYGSAFKRRFRKEDGLPERNPHMKGTTLALRTIFGLGGTDHATEFLNLDGEQVHMFDCFALVNRLICSAHLTGTSTGRSTTAMLRNCERHFAATLMRLEPTIVVIQGVRMWRWSRAVLEPQRWIRDHLVECELDGQPVLVATLSHPSAHPPLGWASEASLYFKELVRPALMAAARLSR